MAKNTTEIDLADMKPLTSEGGTFLSQLSAVDYLADIPADEFPAHRFADSLPMMRPEELEALENSIKKEGLRKPIILFVDENQRKWILDGRNRAGIMRKLIEDCYVHEDGSLPVVPVQYFLGSPNSDVPIPQQAFWFVRTNCLKRDLSSAQKAATAVLMDIEYDRLTKRRKNKNGDGDEAERKAAMAGCSRSYFYEAKKMADGNALDIVKRVRDGILSMPEGIREFKNRVRALDKPLEDEAGEGTPTPEGGNGEGEAPETPAVVIYDGEKNPVPADWTHVFVLRNSIKDCEKTLKALGLELQAFGEHAGGKHLPIQRMLGELTSVGKALKSGQPHAICPVELGGCGGSGRKGRKECDHCGGLGYLSQGLYAAAKKAQKEGAKRPTPPADIQEEPSPNGESPEDGTPEVPEAQPEGAGV